MREGEKNNSSAAGAPPIAPVQAAAAASPDALKAITNGWHALNYALQYVPEDDFLRPKMMRNLQALAAVRDHYGPICVDLSNAMVDLLEAYDGLAAIGSERAKRMAAAERKARALLDSIKSGA